MPLPDAILAQATLDKFGYDPETLSSGAHKHVVCQCASCPTVFDRDRRNVKDPALCRTCLLVIQKNKPPGKKKGPKPGVYPVPGCVNATATLARFGYTADSVSPGSSKTVVCNCTICHKEFTRNRLRLQESTLCSSCVRAPGAKQSLMKLMAGN